MSGKLNEFMLGRRQVLGAAAAGVAALGLAACGEAPEPAPDNAGAPEPAALDAAAFDKLIAAGTVADGALVASNEWASKIKERGSMHLGVVQTSTLFSFLNEKDGKLRGFDAGLSQLLVRYILGDESKFKITQVTSDTRESLLQSNQVDAVFATYSITEDRKKLVSFAGPYYGSRQSVLVLADNDDINGVDDLAGKNVAAQSGSTGPGIMEEVCPDAKLQEFKTDEEARSALAQGRVDAYVIDRNMLFSDMVKQPGKYKMAGDPFGPEDLYGIGLPLDSDGVAFVNAFLVQIEADGTWEELWKLCIGDRAEMDEVPQPPAIGM